VTKIKPEQLVCDENTRVGKRQMTSQNLVSGEICGDISAYATSSTMRTHDVRENFRPKNVEKPPVLPILAEMKTKRIE